MTKKPDRFTRVQFPREYPQHDVAEHEVLMSFKSDEDAPKFLYWWEEVGAALFQDYLNRNQK